MFIAKNITNIEDLSQKFKNLFMYLMALMTERYNSNKH